MDLFQGNREKTMGFGPKDWGFLRICPPIHKAHNLQRSVTAAAQRILGLSVAAYGLWTTVEMISKYFPPVNHNLP